VLLAASYGRSFAQDAISRRAAFFLAPGSDRCPSVTKPLLKVAGLCSLDIWLEQIKECPRLHPLETQVFIVVNSEHYPHYVKWAELSNFPVDNLISNGMQVFLTTTKIAAVICVCGRRKDSSRGHSLDVQASFRFHLYTQWALKNRI
jgi:hypothetical protein